MSGPDLTPDALKRQYDDKTLTEARTFETKGASRQAALGFLETPEGERYLDLLHEASPNTPLPEL